MIKVHYFNEELHKTTYVNIKYHTFSGGEEHVNMEPFRTNELVCIDARIDSSSELIKLLLVTDAIKRMGNHHISLFIPYIPYARQDRVCQTGDSFSLKVFCDIINSQNYESVYVVDAHSTVSTALLNNVTEFPQHSYAIPLSDVAGKYDFVIAPDAGASKKAVEFAKQLGDIEVVQALKVRDRHGSIVDTKILHQDFDGASCLIVDDIADGGKTFTELATVLKNKNAGHIGLYVTHGIFSRGVEVLYSNNIDDIFTTDSFDQKDNRINVIHKFFS